MGTRKKSKRTGEFFSRPFRPGSPRMFGGCSVPDSAFKRKIPFPSSKLVGNNY